jgi:uncharacterized protein
MRKVLFSPASKISNPTGEEAWLRLELVGGFYTQGLSGRSYLAPDTGMLFVFPWSSLWQFWMWDTLIPLDLIYIEETRVDSGKVVGIIPNTVPLSTDTLSIDRPAKYVIEANAGWCAANNVVVGSEVSLFNIR